jgi:hypothetical protein
MPRSFKWSPSLRSPHQTPLCTSLVAHKCHIPRPSPFKFDHPDYVYPGVQNLKSSGYLCINNQQDASRIQNFILSRNFTCFGHLLCPSSGVIDCTRGNWYVSFRLRGRCLGQSGWNLTLQGSGHVTYMKHTNCHVYS